VRSDHTHIRTSAWFYVTLPFECHRPRSSQTFEQARQWWKPSCVPVVISCWVPFRVDALHQFMSWQLLLLEPALRETNGTWIFHCVRGISAHRSINTKWDAGSIMRLRSTFLEFEISRSHGSENWNYYNVWCDAVWCGMYQRKLLHLSTDCSMGKKLNDWRHRKSGTNGCS
jgi:hypothetical protein